MTNKMIESLYIHVPFCKQLCNYCDFYKKKYSDEQQVSDYETLLLEQYLKMQQFHEEHGLALAPLKSLYLGGGTPSLWGTRGAQFIAHMLEFGQLYLASDCEFTLEVDPNAWSKESIEAWRSIGVNRFSLGVQSMNDTFLKLMDREHKLEDVLELCSYLRSFDANFSVDLLLGLPRSKELQRDVLDELDQLLELRPSHISVYILGVRKHYVYWDSLPEDGVIRKEYLQVSEALQNRDYAHYEVSNFALPGKESFHNLSYWQGRSVAGLGPSATGVIYPDDEVGYRYKWSSLRAAFQLEKLGHREKFIEKLYLSFRTNRGFTGEDLFNGENLEKFSQLIKLWESRGYVTGKNNKRSTTLGYLMVDSLMDDIFRRVIF